jgi:Flp pilus assembly protein TadD/TolB-like protein
MMSVDPALKPSNRARAVVAAAALATAIAARPEQATGQPDLDEPIAGPIDPAAQFAKPREVSTGSALPDIPPTLPDGLAVMAFENNSGVRALDWVVAGIPLIIGERYEHVLGLRPTWGERVVPEGAPVIGDEVSVARFAAPLGARWVVTGWVQRPAWQLRVKSTLWRVDGGKATLAAEYDAVGGMGDAFKLIADTMVELPKQAGWTLPDDGEARLRAPPSKDFYAFTLVGRGLGRWQGAVTIAAVADPDGRVPSPKDPLTGALLPAVRDAVSRDLTKAVLIEPTMVEAQRLLGELWATSAEPKTAARAVGKFAYAVDIRADYVPALRAAAENARMAGKRDIALELYTRLVRQRPWDLDARIGVGDAAWQTGDADLALRELGRVIDRRPDDLKARRLLALIRGARGDVAGLARELEEVVRLAPEDLEAKIDLGAAWSELGRLEDATSIFTTVANARPVDATAHKRVGDLWRRRGDVPRAVEWYGKAQIIAPDDPRPAFLTGATYYEAKRWEDARRAFVRAQRFTTWLPETYVAIGASMWHQGKPGEALWYWRRAATKRPRSVAARYNTVMAASAVNQLELALGQVNVLDTLVHHDDGGAAYLRGVVLSRAGDKDGAREAFGEALRRDPDLGDARWNMGVLGRGGNDLRYEGEPRLQLPFGDREAFAAALAHFASVEGTMTGLRVQFAANVLAALIVVGEGPLKDPKAARTAPRTCPLVTVASRWDAATKALASFIENGVELEEAYRVIATYDDHGETASLGPALRQRVAAARAGYRAAQADVREMRGALKNQLGRELTRRGCREDLLKAAAAQPHLYRTAADDAVAQPGVFVPRPPVAPPASATFYIDNRACPDPLAVYIDGTNTGDVPAGQRIAMQARVGRRTLCLLPQPASVTCGDRGTVREVYLHDGWSVLMHCSR